MNAALFVPVAFDPGAWCFGNGWASINLLVNSSFDGSAPEFQKCVDGVSAVLKNNAQCSPALITSRTISRSGTSSPASSAEMARQRNRFRWKMRGIHPYPGDQIICHLLADVSSQGERSITKFVKVDAVLAYPARANLFHQ